MPALQGKKIIATSEATKAQRVKRIFEAHGADVLIFPSIKIKEACDQQETIRQELDALQHADWVIFTSTNGIRYFFYWLKYFDVPLKKYGLKYAVIGKASGEKLREEGISPDYIGTTGKTAREFARELMDVLGDAPRKLLIPKGNLASNALYNQLHDFHTCREVVVYNTTINQETNPELIGMIANRDYDMILFLSPSAVEGFVRMTGKSRIDPKHLHTAAIGLTTQKALENNGISPVFMPSQPNLELMAAEMEAYFNNQIHNT